MREIGSKHNNQNKKEKLPVLCSNLKALFLAFFVLFFLVLVVGQIYFNYVHKIRDAERVAEVSFLLTAIKNYQRDNSGSLPGLVDDDISTLQQIGTSSVSCDIPCNNSYTEFACVNMSSALVNAYLPMIPFDPTNGSSCQTAYYVNIGVNKEVIVGACHSDVGNEIVLVR